MFCCRYKNHMMHHQTEAFSCDCPDAPVLDPVPNEHLTIPGPDNNLSRGHIGHSFRKRGPKFYALERHMKVVHLGWLPCAQCEFIFETEEKLSNHLEKCQMSFVCHKCGYEAESQGKLRWHDKNVHDIDPVQCEFCKKTYKNLQRVREHINKVHRPSVCNICGKSVKSMNRHIQEAHTKDSDKRFQCPDCEKGFHDKNRLKVHQMNVHIRSRPFTCR